LIKYLLSSLVGLIIVFLVGFLNHDLGVYLKKSGYDATAISIWKIGDILGNRSSSGELGLAYWIGNSVEKDYEVAKPLLEKGLEGLSDDRLLRYALAMINLEQGKIEKSLTILAVLCVEDQFSGACKQLEHSKHRKPQ